MGPECGLLSCAWAEAGVRCVMPWQKAPKPRAKATTLCRLAKLEIGGATRCPARKKVKFQPAQCFVNPATCHRVCARATTRLPRALPVLTPLP